MRFAIRLGHALAMASACALAVPAAAQNWPVRPVRIIVPYNPGGGVDVVMRLMAPKLSENTGGTFVVENRAGGGGVVGSEVVARAAPDGHTLLASANEFVLNPIFNSKLPYDPLKSFAFITQLAAVQFIVASHPSVPAKTVTELVALSKSRPGQLTFGSAGTAGGPHLAGELFQSMAGIRWVHVPFNSTRSVVGLISGEVDVILAATVGLLETVRSGRARAIAVTGSKRFAGLPDVPTVNESGVPGYIATGFYGFYAPAGTSPELVRRIHTEATRALANPDVKERLARIGTEIVTSSPEEFTGFLRGEMAKWSKVVKESDIRIH